MSKSVFSEPKRIAYLAKHPWVDGVAALRSVQPHPENLAVLTVAFEIEGLILGHGPRRYETTTTGIPTGAQS